MTREELRRLEYMPVSDSCHIEYNLDGMVRIWSMTGSVGFERHQATQIEYLIHALETIRREQINVKADNEKGIF